MKSPFLPQSDENKANEKRDDLLKQSQLPPRNTRWSLAGDDTVGFASCALRIVQTEELLPAGDGIGHHLIRVDDNRRRHGPRQEEKCKRLPRPLEQTYLGHKTWSIT
jgi:hypothetical protein